MIQLHNALLLKVLQPPLSLCILSLCELLYFAPHSAELSLSYFSFLAVVVCPCFLAPPSLSTNSL